MKIAIFGSGPTGLAVAFTVQRMGGLPFIFSRTDDPSQLYGCQYLHGLVLPPSAKIRQARVDYRLNGTAEDYRRKVYGDDWHGKVSPEDLVGEHEAWDLRQTYSILHGRFAPRIIKADIDPLWISDNKADLSRFSLVISTIPASVLCHGISHKFYSHDIWAAGNRYSEKTNDNFVICDSTEEPWYRYSCVFGYTTTEWATQPSDIMKAVRVRKPLRTDCDCFPEIIRMGRYGRWDKSFLVHHAVGETEKLMKGLMI
jgi:hypothetical protein